MGWNRPAELQAAYERIAELEGTMRRVRALIDREDMDSCEEHAVVLIDDAIDNRVAA